MKKLRIEFHVHTCFSPDSILTKRFILLKCKLKKINCLAITDHNTIKGAIKYKPYLEKHGVDVIVGEEILTKEGEIIGLFLTKEISKGLSAKETINEIKKQHGLVYIPHPYDLKRNKTVLKSIAIEKNKNDIDLIEIHNGRNIKDEYSKKQLEIADYYKKIKIIGSDAHSFFELGRNYIVINENIDKITKKNLLSCIKNATMNKESCLKYIHQYTRYVRAFKMVMGGHFCELYRIIKKRCEKRNKKII